MVVRMSNTRTRAAATKPKETEADFATWFEDWLNLRGHLFYHTFDSRHSAAGFPDYAIVTRGVTGRLVFAELKAEDGKVSAAQLRWIAALINAGEGVYTFRPSDRDQIMRILS